MKLPFFKCGIHFNKIVPSLRIICLYSPVFYVLNYILGEGGGGGGGGGGGASSNGLYGETPPEMGYFFRLQVYDGEGILLNEVYESVGKSQGHPTRI